MKNFKETANFIWSIADLLRGDYKQSDYGKVNQDIFSKMMDDQEFGGLVSGYMLKKVYNSLNR